MIFFFQEGSVHVYGCVCLCGIQWVVGGEVAGDFFSLLDLYFPAQIRRKAFSMYICIYFKDPSTV